MSTKYFKLHIIGILFICVAIAGLVIFMEERQPKNPVYAEYGDVEPVDIWLATDTHYIAPELTDGGAYFHKMVDSGDGKYMYGCEEITDRFISQVIEAHPAALILSGDLTFNGARISHEAFAKKLAPIKEAGIKVIALPGNHDLTINRAAKFTGNEYELVDSIDASTFFEIYQDYGFSDALARDDTSLSYITEVAPNVRVLVVDVNTVAGMSGILTNGTLDFVEKQLKQAVKDKAYVIGVTHQTLLTHSELTSQGMIFINNDKLLELYEKYNVLINLSGHMHIQHIKESENGFPEIATGSLMTSPNYHGEIHIGRRQFEYKAVPTFDEDDALYKEARQFLTKNAFRQGAEALGEKNYDEDLADYFAAFNVNYIAGRSDLIPWDDQLTSKWGETDTFVPVYFDVVKREIEQTGHDKFTEYKLKW
jgi:3',5'-cyclic AMP phosphodiesterase CpdA